MTSNQRPSSVNGAPQVGPFEVFLPETLVLQQHTLVRPEIGVPEFRCDVWNLNAIGRPANSAASWGRISFAAFEGWWLGCAKYLAMCLLNPGHPAFFAVNTMWSRPAGPQTVRSHIKALAALMHHAQTHGFPTQITWWRSSHVQEVAFHLRSQIPLNVALLRDVSRVARLLYELRTVIPGGGLREDPWPANQGLPGAGLSPKRPLSTEPVDPEVFFPLMQAAWAYISIFSEDICRADELWKSRSHVPGKSNEKRATYDALFERFLEQGELVPLKGIPSPELSLIDLSALISWRQLSHLVSEGQTFLLFAPHAKGRLRRERVLKAVVHGRYSVGGTFLPSGSIPGRSEPWRGPLQGQEIEIEKRMLREAGYIVIAALTMMRDSEIQEIERGALTTYHGVNAVRSRLTKGHTDSPVMYWWVNDPVVSTIRILEKVSPHSTHLFSSSRISSSATADQRGFHPTNAIARFRKRINSTRASTGLDEIPDGQVSPHMLRRTMAMLTEYERGGQLAAGLQLKHSQETGIASGLTASYTEPHKRWAAELGERKAQRAAELYIGAVASQDPDQVPRGPGTKRISEFIAQRRPEIADAHTRAILLASDNPSMRMGTINMCLGDRRVAACLLEDERTGNVDVRPHMCVPDVCGNSIFFAEHMLLWRAESDKLTAMRKTRNLSPHSKAQLNSLLTTANKILAFSEFVSK